MEKPYLEFLEARARVELLQNGYIDERIYKLIGETYLMVQGILTFDKNEK